MGVSGPALELRVFRDVFRAGLSPSEAEAVTRVQRFKESLRYYENHPYEAVSGEPLTLEQVAADVASILLELVARVENLELEIAVRKTPRQRWWR